MFYLTNDSRVIVGEMTRCSMFASTMVCLQFLEKIYQKSQISRRKEENVLFNESHILITVIWRRTYGKGGRNRIAHTTAFVTPVMEREIIQ